MLLICAILTACLYIVRASMLLVVIDREFKLLVVTDKCRLVLKYRELSTLITISLKGDHYQLLS